MKKAIKSLFFTAALATSAIAGGSEVFGGLGMSVFTSKNGVKVAGIIPNSPAQNIGLQSGDLIVSANGTELSKVEPNKQVSYLRGEAGSSVDLVVDRNGEKLSLSTKRVELSINNLDEADISAWYGKTNGLTAEEISFLAGKKIGENYELLSVMQYGMPIETTTENLNAKNMQHVSAKKLKEQPETKPIEQRITNQHYTNKTQNATAVNAKGAITKEHKHVRSFKRIK